MFSRKKLPSLVVGSLLILAGEALAQSQPKASEIVEQVNSTYQKLRSFHFEAQYINEKQREGVMTRSESKMIFASDGQGRRRIEYKNPGVEFLRLFDGGARWTYSPMNRQYSREIRKNPKSLDDGPIAYLMFTTAVESSLHTLYAEPESDADLRPPLKSIHGRPMETIKVGDQEVSAYVVEIEYSFVPAEGRELRRTLWIDQLRFIVLRDLAIRKETRSGKTTELRSLINLTVAKVNEVLPGDLFIFKPPPEARQVEFPIFPFTDVSDLLPKAMYGEPDATKKGSAIPAGIPGGVGASRIQETAPLKPDQLKASGVEPGKPIKSVQPDYPLYLQRALVSGTVQVQIAIDEKGNVIDAEMISGHLLLEAVSLKAAREWKFKPTLFNGAPVKAHGILTFTFTPPKK